MLPETLGYLFEEAAAGTPEAVAVIDADGPVTYGQLDGAADRLAAALQRLGVEPGDRIALLIGNEVRFLETLFGAVRARAIPVPLNLRYGDATLRFILHDSGAKVMIAGKGQAERAGRLVAGTPGVGVVASEPIAGRTDQRYDDLVGAESDPAARQAPDPSEPCLLMYTSGSTGTPKGVLLTHAGQIWNADALRTALRFDRESRALVSAPLCHKNAMMWAVKPVLLAGGSLVILPAFAPAAVLDAIERHRVTYLTGVPAMYRQLLANPERLRGRDLRSVRFAKCGSATTPPDLLAAFTATFGAPMVEGYGLTEGGPVPISHTRDGRAPHGSCGRVLPGGQARLCDPEAPDRDVPAGEVGELVVRNPGVCAAYWKRPDVTSERLRDGWLWTGDLMRQDEDGYFYFVGRKDDMMIVSGENVYPKEVEQVLGRHPNVRDVCVVALEHPVKGVVPVAFVIEHDAGASPEEELKAFYLANGSPFSYPRRVYFLTEFPLTSAGKVDRQALVDRAAGLGALAPADKVQIPHNA